MSRCSCQTVRITVAGESIEQVARHDVGCPTHGFPGDEWRAGSPLARFAQTFSYMRTREFADGHTVTYLQSRKETPREVAERLIAETRGGMLGRIYYERGLPVVILRRWNGKGPRNVLIRRGDGSKIVRPFRGLRKNPP